MRPEKQIAIIGAGPCGLMAAEVLSAAGCGVTVYDRMPSPARKLLIAGRGGLNLTHSEPLERFVARYGEAQLWLEPSIRAFPPEALRAWCEGLGQETFVGSSGRVFPRSMKAVQLLRAWLQRLEQQGVQYKPRHTWQGWQGTGLLFRDGDGQVLTVQADATLLALGGASWPRLGSDGAWTEWLRAKAVQVSDLRPSNSGFVVPWTAHFSERFAGEPLKTIALRHGEASHRGEAMLTAQGIEGGAVYALSASIRTALEAEGKTMLWLDLRPNMSEEDLARKLSVARGNKSLSTYLRGMGFAPQAVGLLREIWTAEQLSQATAEELAAWLKAILLPVTGVADIARAISSAGGICRHEVNADFMLRQLPGVFVAGEMLDWEAPTGGYLLQACYSTAVAAAQGMLCYLDA